MLIYKKRLVLPLISRKISPLFLLILGLSVWFLCSPRAAYAQKAGLAVGPAIFEAVVTPGESYKQKIKLQNITSAAMPIKVHARALEKAQDVELSEGADVSIFDASTWITYDTPDLILQPGQTREITLTIIPPPDAEPGGHYATVLFTPLAPTNSIAPNKTYLSSEVGSLAFLTVKGEITEAAELKADVMTRRLQHFGPVATTFRFKNSGNVHNIPTGEIRVLDYRGREVHKEALPSQVVLPGTVNPYKLQWGKSWMFNRYKIIAELTYGTSTQKVSATTAEIWVIPWLPLGLLLLSVIIFPVVAIKTRRRWAKAWHVLRGKEPHDI